MFHYCYCDFIGLPLVCKQLRTFNTGQEVAAVVNLNTHLGLFNRLTASSCLQCNCLLAWFIFLHVLLCHCSGFFVVVEVLQQDENGLHYPAVQERSKTRLSVAKALRHHGREANPPENANISCSAWAPRDSHMCLCSIWEIKLDEPPPVRRRWFLFSPLLDLQQMIRWKGAIPCWMDARLGFI